MGRRALRTASCAASSASRRAAAYGSRRSMTAKRVLVTGGAGFVGSHTVDALLAQGHEVRVFDSLTGQVHGEGVMPEYLAREIEFVRGDMQDPDALREAVSGMDVV